MTVRRLVAALTALLGLMAAAPAHSESSVDKPYIALTGGIPVFGCDPIPAVQVPGDGVGGACLVVDPGTSVTITIHDLLPTPVAVYVDIDAWGVGQFCSTGPIVVQAPADTSQHIIGVWPGAADAGPDCLPGAATMGTVTFSF